MAIKYKDYLDDLGRERRLTYSDIGMKVERDGKTYDTADDWKYLGYEYTETNIPIELPEPDRLRLLEAQVEQHDRDIELNAEAIEELAGMIGGDE